MFDTPYAILLAESDRNHGRGVMKIRSAVWKWRRVKASRRGAFFLLLTFIFLCAAALQAAEYLTKTVQIINPFPPGAVTDIVARLMSMKMSSLLVLPVVIV